jgi:hypothetical protein
VNANLLDFDFYEIHIHAFKFFGNPFTNSVNPGTNLENPLTIYVHPFTNSGNPSMLCGNLSTNLIIIHTSLRAQGHKDYHAPL